LGNPKRECVHRLFLGGCCEQARPGEGRGGKVRWERELWKGKETKKKVGETTAEAKNRPDSRKGAFSEKKQSPERTSRLTAVKASLKKIRGEHKSITVHEIKEGFCQTSNAQSERALEEGREQETL